MGRVSGKIALITGGASGLGRADALALAREGARVVITDVSEEAGRALAKDIDGEFVRHDVRSEDDWHKAIAHTLARFGKLDILVNNAGIVVPGDIETATLEQYRLLNAIHAEGSFLGCKYGIEAMKANPGSTGSIINISSLSAIRGFPGVITYAAAKGAILAMTTTIAAHFREKGYAMRCNAILPGMINTPLLAAVGADTLPGLGQPDDIANTVLFLASDESRHVSGAHIVVDNASSIIGGGA
ncbi:MULTISPECIES: SDR family oxidoreductase [Zoogloea]|jgi:3(or 17)beta-hydroxysteroid dehydrogenase|uniref:SDR family oxidoreductase n=1 Tax=Zoogloea oleivorans TaxID=1552750 RepID=A0A6C2CHW1_9RHOO|nr:MULTISPECIES: SDR family oxidoreductase [Zoogloea]MBT9498100.1 SDR family oxidoreductase [Zoogloea sp.]MDD2668947.1 SDR family oxidoreductase [Zoogloea sp.]MDY0036876.1 SDR family oxidoreductase [Zoogloea oleivorans]TYC53574.1 SDR family oxidoreductase [Zoogloea oleivorans]